MWRRRKRVRACSSSAVRSVPSTSTVPALGRSMPAITLSRVDFPEPLRPTSTAISPLAMVTDTSRSTTRSISASRYDLLTFRSSTAGRHIARSFYVDRGHRPVALVARRPVDGQRMDRRPRVVPGRHAPGTA